MHDNVYMAQIFVLGNAIINFFTETNWVTVVFWLKILSFALSALLVWAIFVTLKRHRALMLAAYAQTQMAGEAESEPEVYASEEWLHIREKWMSPLPTDKRLALIEADAMVDNVLRDRGVDGETMAERINNCMDLPMEAAGELGFAHKFRNELVHETNPVFDVMDSERAFKAYENVLKELSVI
jgi:hypothetical protein